MPMTLTTRGYRHAVTLNAIVEKGGWSMPPLSLVVPCSMVAL